MKITGGLLRCSLTWAYLRSALYPGDSAWANAATAFAEDSRLVGRIDSKYTGLARQSLASFLIYPSYYLILAVSHL